MPVSHSRISWADYAKGICIVLVVMMHSTLGAENAAGGLSWLHDFIAWAKPFLMPGFFLISGLFLAPRINRPWREYFDSKVLHFAYFYILWMTIQFATKGYGLYLVNGAESLFRDYALGFVEPFGTLWFIYMLAVFFLVAKLTRLVPPLYVFLAGAILEVAAIATGHMVIDAFAARFVYFFAGYWLAGYVFKFAEEVNFKSVPAIISGLFIWAVGNTIMVRTGLAQEPGLGLGLGFLGAAAVISMGVLLSKTRLAAPIRYFGENSIVIYLAFFLFMAATRSLLLKYNVVADPGRVALLTSAAGVVGPILLFWATRHTKLSLLFRRPQWVRLASRPAQWHSDGHATFNQPEARGPSLSR